jgi:hypothetical protein
MASGYTSNNTVVAGIDGYTSNNTGISEKENKDGIYTIIMIGRDIFKIQKKDTGFFIECEYLPGTNKLQCKKKKHGAEIVRGVHIDPKDFDNSVGENPVKYLFNVFDKNPKELYDFFKEQTEPKEDPPKKGGRRRTKRRKHTTKKTRRRHH